MIGSRMDLRGRPAAIIFMLIAVAAALIITITFVNPSTFSYVA